MSEDSFRRGFTHGFEMALGCIEGGYSFQQLCNHADRLMDWRDGRIQSSQPPKIQGDPNGKTADSLIETILQLKLKQDRCEKTLSDIGFVLPVDLLPDPIPAIADFYEVPKDNVLDLIPMGEEAPTPDPDGLYCRDWIYELWEDVELRDRPLSDFIEALRVERHSV